MQLWQLKVYGSERKKLDWSILPLQLRNHHCFLTNWPNDQDWKALFVEQDVSSIDTDQWWVIWTAFNRFNHSTQPTVLTYDENEYQDDDGIIITDMGHVMVSLHDTRNLKSKKRM